MSTSRLLRQRRIERSQPVTPARTLVVHLDETSPELVACLTEDHLDEWWRSQTAETKADLYELSLEDDEEPTPSPFSGMMHGPAPATFDRLPHPPIAAELPFLCPQLLRSGSLLADLAALKTAAREYIAQRDAEPLRITEVGTS